MVVSVVNVMNMFKNSVRVMVVFDFKRHMNHDMSMMHTTGNTKRRNNREQQHGNYLKNVLKINPKEKLLFYFFLHGKCRDK